MKDDIGERLNRVVPTASQVVVTIRCKSRCGWTSGVGGLLGHDTSLQVHGNYVVFSDALLSLRLTQTYIYLSFFSI